MAAVFGRKHNKDCCCGGCTIGCCIPIDHSNPIYEPYGTPKNIPFQIVAPGCPVMDGFTGELFCGGAVPVTDKGTCGPCLSCTGAGDDLPAGGWLIMATQKLELGSMCVDDSCSFYICVVLQCRQETLNNESVESCCQKFRLLLGISGSDITHIDNEDPTISVAGSPCTKWKEVEPTTCECGATEADFPAIVFPLDLSVLCDEEHTGACTGFTKCCDDPIDCNLAGATLVI